MVKKAEYMRRACKEKKVSNATGRMSRARQKTGLTPAERKAKSRAAQSAEKREEQLVSNKEYKRRARKEKRDEELVKNNEYKANEKKESNETEKVSKARQ